MANTPLRLARKDVEALLAILRRLAADNGHHITYRYNGSGHVNVCDANGEPLKRRDGTQFSISTTPKRNGGWKQAALQDATRIGLVTRQQTASADTRSKTDKLLDERSYWVALGRKAAEKIAAIDRHLEKIAPRRAA